MFLLLLPAVLHQVFHNLPVHQRFASKKIHFQISPISGIRNQEIKRLFPHLKTHKRPSAVIFSLFRKAIAACQVAVMGNMQAKRFHHCRTVRKIFDSILIDILRKQDARLFQLPAFRKSLPNRFFRIFS